MFWHRADFHVFIWFLGMATKSVESMQLKIVLIYLWVVVKNGQLIRNYVNSYFSILLFFH